MNREELQKLIDEEVSKVLSDSFMEEVKPEQSNEVQNVNPTHQPKQITNITEEELDDFLFYGGKRTEDI